MKSIILISSGLSGGINAKLIKDTKNILGKNFDFIDIQFANDPEYNKDILKDYDQINLGEIYNEFDKVINNKIPNIYIGHSFSSLLIMYYLLERDNLIKEAEKVILLDPSVAEDTYKYIINNQDGFTLDQSIVNKLNEYTNRELIEKMKKHGVEVITVEAEAYKTNHEFSDEGVLKKIYADNKLL